MKCKIFIGEWDDAQDMFNKWAHCKTLGKDVIIHEQVMTGQGKEHRTWLAIIVYHPETVYWDKTEPQPMLKEDSEEEGYPRMREYVVDK